MRFLLDTDTCVFWLRGHWSIRHRMSAIEPEATGISVVTLAELLYGAAWSAQPEANRQTVDDFASGTTVLGIDARIAYTFGGLKADLRRQGDLIEDFDLLIAATALTYGLTLVTNNAVHFGRIPGLSFETWVQTLR